MSEKEARACRVASDRKYLLHGKFIIIFYLWWLVYCSVILRETSVCLQNITLMLIFAASFLLLAVPCYASLRYYCVTK